MQMFGGYTPASEPRLLRVVGEGRLDAPPDSVVITLGVTARADQAAAAYQQAAAIMNQIIRAMLDLGIPRDQLQTGQISLNPVYDENRLVGYEASSTVRVTLRDLAMAGAVIDRGVEAGANTVQGVEFQLREPGAYEARALNLAVGDAQQKASVLARSLGVQLGPVWRAEEEGAPGPIIPLAARAFAAEGLPVLPGTLPVVSRVLVEYLIH